MLTGCGRCGRTHSSTAFICDCAKWDDRQVDHLADSLRFSFMEGANPDEPSLWGPKWEHLVEHHQRGWRMLAFEFLRHGELKAARGTPPGRRQLLRAFADWLFRWDELDPDSDESVRNDFVRSFMAAPHSSPPPRPGEPRSRGGSNDTLEMAERRHEEAKAGVERAAKRTDSAKAALKAAFDRLQDAETDLAVHYAGSASAKDIHR